MKKVRNLPTNPCHCIDFIALVRKVPLKKFDPPVKTFHGFAIALTSMVTKAGHNCEGIHIIFWHLRRGLHQEWKERKVKRNGILDVVSLKHNLLVLLKAMLPVCIVYTAQGESQVANIAWGNAKCYILSWDSHLVIYHTNEAAVL